MNIKNIHFSGICGTAMGAVASAMANKGYRVTGSDENVYPPMSTFLKKQDITITQGYSPDNIPDDTDLVIIGNAMSRGNPEVEAVLERKLRYMSLPEAMKEFFLWGKKNYVVTGTHGKTTTTSMLTWIMENSQLNPSFMIGGIARNLGCGGRFTDSDYCVLEGDEYDTAFFDKRSKFLHYLPQVVIINNIEMDHADIYNSVEEIKLSFKRLLRLIPSNGIVYLNADCPNCREVWDHAKTALRNCVRIESVGLSEHADHRIANLDLRPDSSSFTLDGEPYKIPMAGEFNVRNAAMAASAALHAGLTAQQIRAAFDTFQGIARRQEIRGVINGVTVIDDFAHHPTAITQAISGLRQLFPKSRLWVLFDPRSNTMIRNTLQKELGTALSTADFVALSSAVNFKRVKPEERLDLEALQTAIQATGTDCYLGKGADDIVTHVITRVHPGDILAVMSNGSFDSIHSKLLAALAQ